MVYLEINSPEPEPEPINTIPNMHGWRLGWTNIPTSFKITFSGELNVQNKQWFHNYIKKLQKCVPLFHIKYIFPFQTFQGKNALASETVLIWLFYFFAEKLHVKWWIPGSYHTPRRLHQVWNYPHQLMASQEGLPEADLEQRRLFEKFPLTNLKEADYLNRWSAR